MMQAILHSTDERLIDELTNVVFQEHLDWTVCASAEEMERELLKQPYSRLIVSDRHMDFGVLEETLERYRKQWPGMKIMVLISNYHETSVNVKYVKMCKLKKLDYVQPGRGTAIIADLIRAWIDQPETDSSSSQGQGKLIAFVGSTPNIGTTLASFGTAYALAAESSASVGYMCLNLKSSKLHRYLGRDDKAFTLDGLRAELKAQSLTPHRLRQVCDKLREAPGLHVLFGNMLREQAEFFTPMEVVHLLRVARAAFDVCVVEVNAYWDNAATVCGLLEADTRIVVTTPDLAQFQEDFSKWIRQVGSVFGLQPDTFDLIAVQTDTSPQREAFNSKDIRKETQLHLIGEISRHADALSFCNQGKLLELYKPGHPMREETAAIARKLSEYYQLPRRSVSRKATWIRRILTRRAAT